MHCISTVNILDLDFFEAGNKMYIYILAKPLVGNFLATSVLD